MSNVVIMVEANRPLTRKRIFQAKLEDAPLCFFYTDWTDNFRLLFDTGIFELTENNTQYESKYHCYVIFKTSTGEPTVFVIQPNQKFNIDHEQAIQIHG